MRRSAKKERRYQRRDWSHDHRENRLLEAVNERSPVPGAQEDVPRRLFKHYPMKVHNYIVEEPAPGHRGQLVSADNSELYYDYDPDSMDYGNVESQRVIIEEPRRTSRPVKIQKRSDRVHHESDTYHREAHRTNNQAYPQTMRVHEQAVSGISSQSKRYLDSKGRLFILVDNNTRMYVGDLSPRRWVRKKKTVVTDRRNESLPRGVKMTHMIDEDSRAEYPVSSRIREADFIQEVRDPEPSRQRSHTMGSSGRRHRRMHTKSNNLFSDDESVGVVLPSEKKKERLKGQTRKKRLKKKKGEGELAIEQKPPRGEDRESRGRWRETVRSDEFSVDDDSIKLLKYTGRAVSRRTDEGRRRRRRTEDFGPRKHWIRSGMNPKQDKGKAVLNHRRTRTTTKLPKHGRGTGNKLSSRLMLTLKESRSPSKSRKGKNKKPAKNRNTNKFQRRVDAEKERRTVSQKKPSKKKTTTKRDGEKKRPRKTKGGIRKKLPTPSSPRLKREAKHKTPHGVRRKTTKGKQINPHTSNWLDDGRSSVYWVQDANKSQSKDFPFIHPHYRPSVKLTGSPSSRRNSSLADEMHHDAEFSQGSEREIEDYEDPESRSRDIFSEDPMDNRLDDQDEEKAVAPSNPWSIMHNSEAGSSREDLSRCETEVLSSLSSDQGYQNIGFEDRSSMDNHSESDSGWVCSWENWVLQQSMENGDEGNQQNCKRHGDRLIYGQNPNRGTIMDENAQSRTQVNNITRQYPRQDAPQVSIKDKRPNSWLKPWKQSDAMKKRVSLAARQEKHVSSKRSPLAARHQDKLVLSKRLSMSRQQEKHFSTKRASLAWEQEKHVTSKRKSLAARQQEKHHMSKRKSLTARQQEKHMSNKHTYVLPRQQEMLANWKILQQV